MDSGTADAWCTFENLEFSRRLEEFGEYDARSSEMLSRKSIGKVAVRPENKGVVGGMGCASR